MVRPVETLNAKTLVDEDLAVVGDPGGLTVTEGVRIHVGSGDARRMAHALFGTGVLKQELPDAVVVDESLAAHEWKPVYVERTATGRVLGDEDFERLADEAQQGHPDA